jgi:hypothetical protein
MGLKLGKNGLVKEDCYIAYTILKENWGQDLL